MANPFRIPIIPIAIHAFIAFIKFGWFSVHLIPLCVPSVEPTLNAIVRNR